MGLALKSVWKQDLSFVPFSVLLEVNNLFLVDVGI